MKKHRETAEFTFQVAAPMKSAEEEWRTRAERRWEREDEVKRRVEERDTRGRRGGISETSSAHADVENRACELGTQK